MTRNILDFIKRKAIFIMASFVLLSCEKSTGALGLDLVIDDKAVLGTKRNIGIKSYTIKYDSIASTNPQYVLAGDLKDPAFGTTHHEFVMQMYLDESGLSPDFGDNPVVDSVKLVVPYGDYYGDTTAVTTMEVLELDDEILDTSYYSDHSFSATNQMALSTFTPKPKSRTIVDDEVISPSLVLDIDTGWAGERIIRGSISNSAAFESNIEFVKHFKGLKFTTNNTGNSILYFDIANQSSIMRIYYRQHKDSTEAEFYDLVTTTASNSVNTTSFNYVGAEFDLSNQDTVNGEVDTYLQSLGGVATRISFKELQDYKDSNFVVNKAELIVRLRPGSASELEAPMNIALVEDKNGEYYYIKDIVPGFNENFGGVLETDALRDRKYVFNISRLIHDYINTDAVVNDLVIVPLRNATAANRAVLGGSDNGFIPLEFNLYYTRTN